MRTTKGVTGSDASIVSFYTRLYSFNSLGVDGCRQDGEGCVLLALFPMTKGSRGEYDVKLIMACGDDSYEDETGPFPPWNSKPSDRYRQHTFKHVFGNASMVCLYMKFCISSVNDAMQYVPPRRVHVIFVGDSFRSQQLGIC